MKSYLNPIINRLAVCSFILFAGMTLKNHPSSSVSAPGAKLIAGLEPLSPLINKEKCVISVLYGNKIACQQINVAQRRILPGEIFTLLSWKAQADDNWIGANIPGELLTAEVLRSSRDTKGNIVFNYQRFGGPGLVLIRDTTGNAARIYSISHPEPAILP